MREEYLALIGQIRYHMKKYYDEDAAEISDYEYDQLMLRLKEIERAHPDWIAPDSPSQVVGASATAGVPSTSTANAAGASKRTFGVVVQHDVPMLSIQDVFSKEEVTAWADEVRALHGDALFCVEEKIDGLSMSLRYENGALVLAETRGDGFTGEDVTVNARVVKGAPHKLSTPYEYLEVRGEVYMRRDDFDRVNALQEARGKKTFANPRNCAAGTLRQLDAAVTKERGLCFYVHNVQRASDDQLTTSHDQALTKLSAEEGMQTAPRILCRTNDEILRAIDEIGARRGALDYDIDGAVVKLDQIAYRDDFPAGSKYSAGHIAYKYPPEEKEATITEIELTVGMTGRVNPTAIFTPVQLCGTTVSRATLHNQDFIDKLGVGIGKKVLVYKSGEIIPKIRGTVTDGKLRTEEDGVEEMASYAGAIGDYRKERGIFAIPDTCPVCGGAVVRGRSGVEKASEGTDEGETAADMYCVNPDCPAKLVRRMINFVSRDAMDIKGFGAEYVAILIQEGYIRNIDDLYTLKQHRDELVEKGLIGKEKNTDKLLNVIEQSKQNEPWRLLAGLAIANVGRTSARTLMRHFPSIEELSDASVEELTEVEDVGEITAQAIHDYFADEAHRALLKRLKDAGVRMSRGTASGAGAGVTSSQGAMSVAGAGTDGAASGGMGVASAASGGADAQDVGTLDADVADTLAGRTYVVTGDLQHFKNRDELIDFIEARGGKVAGSVSKKTYALINNDAASTSGKNKKAQELGIPILTEDAFLKTV